MRATANPPFLRTRPSFGRAGPLLVGAWSLGACAGDAEPDVVARVDDRTLTVERLADLMVLAQPLPLDTATAGALVDQWIDASALARRSEEGADLEGPTAASRSLWIEHQEAWLEVDRRARLGPIEAVTPDRARAVFAGDSLLLLAHTLKATGPASSASEHDLQRRSAQSILDRLLAGGSWDSAAAESDDLATRSASGLLGLVRLADLPPELRGPASRLQPGQVSSVVRSTAGYHVLHRPRFADVAELYASLLAERQGALRDVAIARRFADSLGVSVGDAAVSQLRAKARGHAVDGSTVLAEWPGGTLTADAVEAYLLDLPWAARRRLAASDGDAIRAFLIDLAVREARIDGVRARGMSPDPAVVDALAAQHRREIAQWRTALGDGTPTAYTPEAVDRFMDAIAARREPARTLPPLFRRWLLEPLSWHRDPAAIRVGVARARTLVSAADEGP